MTEAEWLSFDDPQAMLRIMNPHNAKECHKDSPWWTFTPSARKLRLFAVACCRQVWDRLTDNWPCEQCGGHGKFGFPVGIGFRLRVEIHDCGNCSGTGRINRSRRAVEVAERFADGQATEDELRQVRNALPRPNDPGFVWQGQAVINCVFPDKWGQASVLSEVLVYEDRLPGHIQADLLRDIFGNPFRPVELSHRTKCKWCGYYTDEPHGKYCEKHGDDPDGKNSHGWVKECLWLTSTVLDLTTTIYNGRRFGDMPILWDALADAGCCDEEIRKHCCWCDSHLRNDHVKGCWLIDLILGKE